MKKSWLPEFSHQDFEILSEDNVYSGYCAVKHYRLRYRLFQGGWSHPVERELMCRPESAAVLLYDPASDTIVMIEQIRVGALQDTESPWMLEIVAGLIDPGETPESTAFRESKEEANCELLSLRHIYTYRVSAGISDEITHIYCGIIKAPTHSSIHGLAEEGEDIKLHILSSAEVIELLNRGKITSASAIIALQWFALNHSSLRATQ